MQAGGLFGGAVTTVNARAAEFFKERNVYATNYPYMPAAKDKVMSYYCDITEKSLSL